MNCFVVATTVAVAVLSSLGRDACLPLFYILASAAAAAAFLLAYYVLRFFFRGIKSRSKHNFSQSIGTRIGVWYIRRIRVTHLCRAHSPERNARNTHTHTNKTNPKWDKTVFDHDWMEVSREGGSWGERANGITRTSGKLIGFYDVVVTIYVVC